MRGMWCYYSEKYESLKGFLTPRALHKHGRRKCTHGKVHVRKTWPETQQTTFTRKLNLTPTSAAHCSRVCQIRGIFKAKYLAELLLINSPSVKPSLQQQILLVPSVMNKAFSTFLLLHFNVLKRHIRRTMVCAETVCRLPPQTPAQTVLPPSEMLWL